MKYLALLLTAAFISQDMDSCKTKNRKLKDMGGFTPQEKVVSSTLNWLARHQNDNGSWSATEYTKHCGKFKKKGKCEPVKGDKEFDVAVTGLVTLSFLGAGYAPGIPGKPDKDGINYATVVKKALKYLLKIQDSSGRIGKQSDHHMYNHVLATLALIEAYDMTQLKPLKEGAQKALDYVIKAQNTVPAKKLNKKDVKKLIKDLGGNDPTVRDKATKKLIESGHGVIKFLKQYTNDKDIERQTRIEHIIKEIVKNTKKLGWGYKFKSGKSNSIMTGYCSMVLKSAEFAKLKCSRKKAYEGIKRWYDSVTDKKTGAVGFNQKPKDGKVDSMTSTAAAIMAKLFMRHVDDAVKKGAKLLLNHLPKWDQKNKKVDFEYWYFATYAIYQYYSFKDPEWDKWNKSLQSTVVPNQIKGSDICKGGSWEPVGKIAPRCGRAGTTALGTLIMEVYYRYARVR